MTLGKRTDFGNSRYVGIEVPFQSESDSKLRDVSELGFDFLIMPLCHPTTGSTTPSLPDFCLVSNHASHQVVGRVGMNGGEMLVKELDWAIHCGVHAVVISLPLKDLEVEYLARIINWKLDTPSCSLLYWIQIKLQGGEMDPWELWNRLRILCGHHSSLTLVLELTSHVPVGLHLTRYFGEPIKGLIIPTECFLMNKKGYPTLPKSHKKLIEDFIQIQTQLVLSGPVLHWPEHPQDTQLTNGLSNGISVYQEYLSYVYRSLPPVSEKTLIQQSYQDQLQLPLEPLKDNLESKTYAIFERDSPKYEAYGKAIFQALGDWPDEEKEAVVVIMVLGAGRGPLVELALKAAKDCARRVRIYAIDKNPYALLDLQSKAQQKSWGENVSIVHEDMRNWDAPEKADIIISELLGSFGDNELSPECLDGAQRLLKDSGISIPCFYRSYCVPITASKAYSMALAFQDPKKLETSFVVKLSNVALLSNPLPVFEFEHPKTTSKSDNSRYRNLEFVRVLDAPSCLMHGLAGYFETVLYKDIKLSTLPHDHTVDMESWFPMFFPLKTPITIPKGCSKIQVQFWRCVGNHKVWYEWSVSHPIITCLHNANGSAISVGL